MDQFQYDKIDNVIQELTRMGYNVDLERTDFIDLKGIHYDREFAVRQQPDAKYQNMCVGVMIVSVARREALYGEYNIARCSARSDPTLRIRLDEIKKLVFG